MFLVYWASFFHICLYFWTQIKHPKLFLKHNVSHEKRVHYIAYNNICTTKIVHIIILILGEIWSKGSNLTSLLLVNVFADIAEVNFKALKIKSYQPSQKHCQGSAEAKCIFILLPRNFISDAKNAEIRGQKTDPSAFKSTAPVPLDWSNKTSWVFPALKSSSHFLPQSTESCRSDSSSEANSSSCHKPDAWSHLE